ncbi:MAG: ABC transporter ATP-binding protein [SAR202 cluster bacterium]|jgi:ATP-binding cassette subfamily B protein|nr:ABC transporter ATP-binding protein [SAR202 cluster bacterium]|tara:strand:+ start:880 stop:2694 length:1815 start_codon:yes stop_codon:yes gene_type:complete
MIGHTFGPMSRGSSDDEMFGKLYDINVIKRITPYIWRYKKYSAIGAICTLVSAGLAVLIPYFIKIGIDDYINNTNISIASQKSGLIELSIIFALTMFAAWITNYIGQIFLARVGQNVLRDIRIDMFTHLQKLNLNYFQETKSGSIMSRMMGDTSQLQESFAIVVMTLADILSLIGICTTLLLMNFKIGISSLSVLPLLFFAVIIWQPIAKKSFINVRIAISQVLSSFSENLNGIKEVQNFNREDNNYKYFSRQTDDHIKAALKAQKLSSALLPPVDILTSAAIIIASFVASKLILNDAAEIGVIIASVLYIQRLFDPIRNLMMQYTQIQRSMASGSRLFEFLDIKNSIHELKIDNPKNIIKGKVEFENFHFAYDNDIEVLTNINMKIQEGATIAFIGDTGAGKTTLASLITGLYPPNNDKGKLSIDNIPIENYSRSDLGSQIAMVLQDPFLFQGSLKENLKFNQESATDEEMINACKSIGIHDYIISLDNEYDTSVSERGVNMSQGQRQLMGFARALIKNPKILILDEATSNIDSISEQKIQNALKVLFENRTSIVIAHRLSTIKLSDNIFVIKGGKIAEQGNHATLMNLEKEYYKFTESSFQN